MLAPQAPADGWAGRNCSFLNVAAQFSWPVLEQRSTATLARCAHILSVTEACEKGARGDSERRVGVVLYLPRTRKPEGFSPAPGRVHGADLRRHLEGHGAGQPAGLPGRFR